MVFTGTMQQQGTTWLVLSVFFLASGQPAKKPYGTVTEEGCVSVATSLSCARVRGMFLGSVMQRSFGKSAHLVWRRPSLNIVAVVSDN